jgi:hypothetical protein
VARLLAVATHSPAGSSTELDALRLAADAAKQGLDTGVYLQVCLGVCVSACASRRASSVCVTGDTALTSAALHRHLSRPQVTERIAGRLGAAYVTDGDWVDETNRKAAQARPGVLRGVSTLPLFVSLHSHSQS